MKTLKSQQLGDNILEFSQKQHHNRLKARHKRYMTMEIKGQEKEKIDTWMRKCQAQKNQIQQAVFESITKGKHLKTLSGADFPNSEQESKKTVQAVRKNIYLANNIDMTKKKLESINIIPQIRQQRYQNQLQEQTVKKLFIDGQIKGRNIENISQNLSKNLSDQRYFGQEIQSIELTKTKPLKSHCMHYSKSISELVPYATSLNFASISTQDENNVYIFKKTKRRKYQNGSSNLGEQQVNEYNGNSQNADSKQCEPKNQDSKHTICYGRVPFKITTNIKNRDNVIKIPTPTSKSAIQNQIKVRITNIKSNPTKQNENDKYSHYRRFSISYNPYLIQQNIQSYDNISDEATQLIQQQHQPTSTSSSSEHHQQALSTRVGRTKTSQTQKKYGHRYHNTDNINRIQDINNQLDLGMKIIDDSFEISDFDQNNIHEIIHQLGTNNLNTTPDVPINGCKTSQIIMQQSVISPQCQQLRDKLNSVLESNNNLKRHRYIGSWVDSQNLDIFSDISQQYAHEYNTEDIDIQLDIPEQEEQQQEEQYQLNTFIHHSESNPSEENIEIPLSGLARIPFREINIQEKENRSENGNVMGFKEKCTKIQHNRLKTKSVSLTCQQYLRNTLYKQLNFPSQTNSNIQYSYLNLQLAIQNLQIDETTGLILHNASYIIKNSLNNKIINQISNILADLISFSTFHPSYMQYYGYKLEGNLITLYKEPLFLSNLYYHIYNLKSLANNMHNINMQIDLYVIRSIIKQLLSVFFCGTSNSQKKYTKINIQDIYLCEHVKEKGEESNKYDVKIDKSTSMLPLISNTILNSSKNNQEDNESIIRYNLKVLVSTIKILTQISMNNNIHNNACASKLSGDFLSYLENTHKIDIQNILTHPYIWSDLPHNVSNSSSSCSLSLQQVSIIYQ